MPNKGNNSEEKSFWANYNLAFQIVLTILILAFAGHYLDGYMETEKPWFTLTGGVFGVIVSLVNLIRSTSSKK